MGRHLHGLTWPLVFRWGRSSNGAAVTPTRRAVVRALEILFAMAVAYFGGGVIVKAWKDSQGSLGHFGWGAMTWGIPALAGAYVLSMRLSKVAVLFAGARLSWRQTFQIWSVPQVISYVPGKVWWVLIRFQWLQRISVPAAVAVVDVYIESVIGHVGSVAAGALAVAGTSSADLLRIALVSVMWFALFLVMLAPQVSAFLFRRVARVFRTDAVPPKLTFGQVASLILHATAVWLAFGGAFATLCFAVAPALVPVVLTRLVGTYALAWFAGEISMLPGGLVAREGTLVYLLGPIMDPKEVIVAAAIMRGGTVAVEMVMGLIARLSLPDAPFEESSAAPKR